MRRDYVPMFSEIVDSSLWKEPLHVRIVFLTFMAMKEIDHVVRLPIHKVANKANVGDELFLDAMKVLEQPDRLSLIEQPYDGRRIEKVADGYFVLNGEYYQKLMQEMNKQARWAKQKRDQRFRIDLKKKEGKKRPLRAGTVQPVTGTAVAEAPVSSNGHPNQDATAEYDSAGNRLSNPASIP